MLRHAKHITLWLLFALMCTSCTGVHDLRDARSVVASADSLRAAGGAPYNDSTSLAFAVTTLEPVRFFYPTDYAHANYYYGRLLRDAGDQPEAMLAFLRAVHSRTKDHEIKARSWSNIASMCRRAKEFSLSCQMDFLSAKQFLANGDSVLYYYSINNIAFDYAEMKDKRRTLAFVNYIESNCSDEAVITNTLETKAELFLKLFQNDSAIYFSEQLYLRGNHKSTGLIIRAQAYDNLGIRDSAVYYANQVLKFSSFYWDRFNAIYILTRNDSTINKKDDILSLNSVRTDIQMDNTEVRADLSQAILLLKQDLERKPNITWLWTLLITLFIIIVPTIVYIQKQKSKRQLLSQQVDNLQQKQAVLSSQIEQAQHLRQEQILDEMERFCNSITSDNIQTTLSWKNFDQMCNIVNQRMFGLVDKLKSRGITSEPELRLCVLVAVGRFNNKEMASLVPYGYDSLKTTKSTIANRLGVSGRKMREFLLHLAL